jgi:XTP/dITP diphosphohydrolase
MQVLKMKLIIASNNKHKIVEIKQILAGKFEEILSLKEAGVTHETLEDQDSFMANALKKAREISAITGLATLADDSGLSVNALGGAPGIFSARFSGESDPALVDKANNALLLEKLSGAEDRSAHFTCAMALVYPNGREVLAEGYMFGRIIESPRGVGGFGYDPLFLPDGEERSVAEMSDEEKNMISHRANALKNLFEKL